jgi:polysaccharide pyruvyl transferase WcaK-like protein
MRCPSKASDDIPLRLRLEVITASEGQECEGLAAIPRRRVGRLLAALRRCDALLLGGGSLLQNASRHGRRSLLYYLGLLCVARALGCPFSLRANGVGPLRGGAWQRLTGWVLRYAAGISLRDEHSLTVLCACGVPRGNLSLCEDGVLWWARRQRRVQPVEPAYVCVCPREADEQDFVALPCLLREYSQGTRLVWVAVGGARDEAVCRALAARMGGEVAVLRQEMAALRLLGGARAVISMRYHALILGCGGSGRLIALSTEATRDKMAVDFEKYRE